MPEMREPRAPGRNQAPQIDPAIVVALQQLCAAYWFCADESADGVGELFSTDAVLTLGSLVLDGRAAIEKFFREREESARATGRTTRHAGCNLFVTALEGRRATVRSVALVYAGSGERPLPATAPAGIVDFADECVQDGSGRWQFASRVALTVFTGPGAPSFAR
jgi:hypothetical protein